ncbi:alpha/beta hydrolase family protein [Amycolatopsis pithecellobii]|uniref:Alpha/beta hydrolase n=1 Tax=Amycolatopsis pithecellobii TaxID=664692 RepID=A0A6N7YPK3_9PSEU|nr:alpha/beta hydrolase [Amycolatopsis pithecellobii]MTD54937.1 alpha/beta hydrolase [Amycolatopsis pithecellobii]
MTATASHDEVVTEVVELKTHDGARVSGTLRRPAGGARVVASLMHPRQDVTHHLLVPELLRRGYAVWTQTARSPNNDISLVHEQALLDVAAGQQFLVSRGYEATVTVGHSGGATLFAFYQQEAAKSPRDRLAAAPSGLPVDLPGADLPVPDAAVFLAPHPGQGVLLQRLIDPSVTDESDPRSVDPALDLYAPENGFAPPPESSTFDEGFLTRYRAAQAERVRRLDQLAREHLAGPDAELAKVMVIYRTDAEPRSVDLSIDSNDRPYGSLFGRTPHRANYRLPGFARVTTPEAWLSTWSATTSRANLLRNAPGVTSPTLLVELTGDQACFPSDAKAVHDAFGATDKTHVRVPGLHFGQPLRRGETSGMARAAEQIGDWLTQHFEI